MTKAKKKTTVTSMRPTINLPTNIVALNDASLKALCMLSSSMMFAAPAFATQANPQNILALADLMWRYVVGSVAVQQPNDVAKESADDTPSLVSPTFG